MMMYKACDCPREWRVQLWRVHVWMFWHPSLARDRARRSSEAMLQPVSTESRFCVSYLDAQDGGVADACSTHPAHNDTLYVVVVNELAEFDNTDMRDSLIHWCGGCSLVLVD